MLVFLGGIYCLAVLGLLGSEDYLESKRAASFGSFVRLFAIMLMVGVAMAVKFSKSGGDDDDEESWDSSRFLRATMAALPKGQEAEMVREIAGK